MGRKKSINFIIFTVYITLAACGPSQAEIEMQETQIAETIFATQTAGAPTATPQFTPTPEYKLNCEITGVPIEEKNRHLNVFALSTSLEEGYEDTSIDGLQVDIIGESKLSLSFGKSVTRIDLQTYRFWVEIDEEWTFLDSGNTYILKGVVDYDNLTLTITSYDLTVTGGGFGTNLKTCAK